MSFYDLSKAERAALVDTIQRNLLFEIESGKLKKTLDFFSDGDTYIRKSAYLSIGKVFLANKKLQEVIIKILDVLLNESDFKIVRQPLILQEKLAKQILKSLNIFLTMDFLTNIIL